MGLLVPFSFRTAAWYGGLPATPLPCRSRSLFQRGRGLSVNPSVHQSFHFIPKASSEGTRQPFPPFLCPSMAFLEDGKRFLPKAWCSGSLWPAPLQPQSEEGHCRISVLPVQ